MRLFVGGSVKKNAERVLLNKTFLKQSKVQNKIKTLKWGVVYKHSKKKKIKKIGGEYTCSLTFSLQTTDIAWSKAYNDVSIKVKYNTMHIMSKYH